MRINGSMWWRKESHNSYSVESPFFLTGENLIQVAYDSFVQIIRRLTRQNPIDLGILS